VPDALPLPSDGFLVRKYSYLCLPAALVWVLSALDLEKLSSAAVLHPTWHLEFFHRRQSEPPGSQSDFAAHTARSHGAAVLHPPEAQSRLLCVQLVRRRDGVRVRQDYQSLRAARVLRHARFCRSDCHMVAAHEDSYGHLHHHPHRRNPVDARSDDNYARMDRGGNTTTDTSRCRFRMRC
jgi:hypothetical protein